MKSDLEWLFSDGNDDSVVITPTFWAHLLDGSDENVTVVVGALYRQREFPDDVFRCIDIRYVDEDEAVVWRPLSRVYAAA